MSDPPTRNVRPERLRALVRDIFVGAGLDCDAASLIAETLVEADLRGVRSHGVMRVPGYIRGLRSGNVNPRPDVRVVVDSGPVVVVDGDGGMGQVSAARAMRLAIARAREHGIGAAGLRNGRHSGTMAYWAMMALPAGCLGFVTTNAGLNMAPWGGRDRLVGNNPFAIAVPTTRPWPMVLDMATSVAAGGKLDVAAIRGESIPLGWALDELGRPTDDPRAARRGTLLPVGGPKGYAMAVMLDVLAGVLTGSRFGGNLGVDERLGQTVQGQFYLALRVESFMPLREFYARMDALIDQIHASTPAPGFDRIYLPGEIEHSLKVARLASGLPLENAILTELDRLAVEAGVADRSI